MGLAMATAAGVAASKGSCSYGQAITSAGRHRFTGGTFVSATFVSATFVSGAIVSGAIGTRAASGERWPA